MIPRRNFMRLAALSGISAAVPFGFVGCADSRLVGGAIATSGALRAYGAEGGVLEFDGNKVRTSGLGASLELNLLENASPIALALANDGRAAIVDASRGTVSLFAHSEAHASVVCGRSTLREPSSVCFAADGSLFVADRSAHRLVVLDANGDAITTIGAFGTGSSGLNGPRALAIADDRVYVADLGNARVQSYGTDGRWLGSFGSYGHDDGCFLAPRALTVDMTGRVYVADALRGDVQVFVDSELVDRFVPHKGLPRALTVRPDGGVDVFVV